MKLEQYRLEEGLTYEELAEKLGLKRSTVYKICQNGATKFSLYLAQRVVVGTNNAVTYEDLSSDKWPAAACQCCGQEG